MRNLWLATSLAVLATACSAQETAPTAAPPAGPPVETADPNSPQYRPAFEGQTRAPGMTTSVELSQTVVAEGLSGAWAMAQLPDGRWLVTERAGALRLVGTDGTVSEPIAGLPAVHFEDQGGLLDVAVSPSFASDRLVYWTYAEPRGAANGTAVARGRLSDDGARLENVEVIFRARPDYANGMHYGSVMAFDGEGRLYVTVGERSSRETRGQAQDLGSHYGKTIRINADGSVPQDNPFVGQAGALPEIFSLGHRNMQSIAVQPGSGAIWTLEHGPRGGDELNREVAGANYGWPEVTYGIEYSGETIGEGITARDGTTQPIYYWDPVIATAGAAFYGADLVPEWRGDLFVSALSGHVARLKLDGERVIGEERLLVDIGARVRDVAVGADGAIYALTDEEGGRVVRLAPAS